jgi:hypothetical protein
VGDVQADGQIVEALERRGGGCGVVHGDGSEHAAELTHDGGGVQVVADDVADDEGEVATGQGERVILVTADLQVGQCGLVAGFDLHVGAVG